MGQLITCTSVGCYGDALTRGQRYKLLRHDEQKRQVRVSGDNERARWFPEGNFDLLGGTVPLLTDWRFGDPVYDPLNERDETKNGVDVTIRLSNGEMRWLIFMTPEYIKWLLEERSDPARWGGAYEPAVWGEHIVVLRDLRAETVGWMLEFLDQRGELTRHSRSIGDIGGQTEP